MRKEFGTPGGVMFDPHRELICVPVSWITPDLRRVRTLRERERLLLLDSCRALEARIADNASPERLALIRDAMAAHPGWDVTTYSLHSG